MAQLEGKKILITGPAGQIAFPLAARLARDNEVWGIARFGDAATRERCEKAGISTRAIDLADPVWGDLPDDFEHILHLAAVIPPGDDYDTSIRINAGGTGALMSRFRNAKSCLVMSSSCVYASPPDGNHPVAETDPLGGTPQPYSPSYPVSKMSQEAVARFACEEFGLPTTIARMNAAYGDNGGLPLILLEMILAGQPIPVQPGRASICTPIHEDDIYAQTAGLLERAAVPASIVNWAGDEPVAIPELLEYIAERAGREAKIVEHADGIHQYFQDPSRRKEWVGPCQVDWKAGVDRMIAARHPELSPS